jgi:tetratricopeptide (TPR) repeat protein
MFTVNKDRQSYIFNILCGILLLFCTIYPVKPGWASQKSSSKVPISQTKKGSKTSSVKPNNKPISNKKPQKIRTEIRNTRYVAALFKRANKSQSAAQLYHEIAEKTDWHDGRAKYLYSEAQSYWSDGNYSKAKDIFSHISDKGVVELKAYVPQTLSEEEKKKRTEKIFKFWVDIDRARFALANIEQIQGNIPRAIKIYQAIEKDSPYMENQRRAAFALGQIEKKQGNLTKAVQLLEKLLTDDNKKTNASRNLDYMAMNSSGSHQDTMRSKFGLFPPEESSLVDKNRVLLALTDIYEEKKDDKKVVETYEALVNASKQEIKKQTYLFLLAKACVRAKFFDKAKKAYSEIIKIEKEKLEKRKKFFSKSKIPLKMGVMGEIAEKEMALLRDKQ